MLAKIARGLSKRTVKEADEVVNEVPSLFRRNLNKANDFVDGEIVQDAVGALPAPSTTIDPSMLSQFKNFLTGNKGKIGLGIGGAAAASTLLDGEEEIHNQITQPVQQEASPVVEQEQVQHEPSPEQPNESSVLQSLIARLSNPERKQMNFDAGESDFNSFVPELQKAQTAANDKRFAADVGQLGDMLGRAISGADENKGITTYFDRMREGADTEKNQLLERYKLQQTELEQDPNSQTSKSFRELAKNMGINLKGDFTAKMGREILPKLYEMQQNDINLQLKNAELDLKNQALDNKAKKDSEPKLSKAQEHVDREFAKNYAKYLTSGGESDTGKMLAQLDEAIGLLESSKLATGPMVSAIPDGIRARAPGFEKGVRAEDYVKEVVQRNLREILGAQFTEREGQLLLQRAFDPRMSEAENAKRVRRLQLQIQQAAAANKAARDWFVDNGTLAGFKGRVFSKADDFDLDDKQSSSGKPKSESSGKVSVRDTTTGQVKLLDKSSAEKLFKNPRYERAN